MTQTQLAHFPNHIAGLDDEGEGRRFESVDPFQGAPWATAVDSTAQDVDRAVEAARAALDGEWGQLSGSERAKLMRRLADLVVRDVDRLADLEMRDNGKLLRDIRGQVAYVAEWFYYYAGWADKVTGSTIPTDKKGFFAYTLREPVGVVGALVPWNGPLLLLALKLPAALAAGCTLVVKPSEYTPSSIVELARLATEAGFPPGVINVVNGWGPTVGQAITSHPGVDKIAFTGSTETGIKVATAAAQRLASVTLELGGKSPQLVFEDADIEAAVNGVVAGVFPGAGQSCFAGSRVFVHESVRDDFLSRVTARLETVRLGDPRDPETDIGPISTDVQFARVMDHLADARREGATVLAGGSQPAHLGGWFVEPTILTDVTPTMRAVREEIFGPVMAVTTFRDEDEVVAMANDSEFGLAAGIWSTNVQRVHRVAARLKVGTVWANAYRAVGPQVPFGGVKASGSGRENGLEGLLEFTETKSVWIETTGKTVDPFRVGIG